MAHQRTEPARPSAAELAAATPPERDRFVDLLRVMAIVAVVSGHWLVIAVDRDGGENLLGSAPWLHPLTWVFQVMPIVFLVGAYGNAASWSSAVRRRTPWAAWFAGRAHRLLRPTTVFLAVATVAAYVARLSGADTDAVADGARVVTVALWFLAVYIVVVAVTPLAFAAHDRWGLRSVVALACGAAVTDAVSLGFGWSGVGIINWALVWLTMTQLGIAWRAGGLTPAMGRRLLAGGATALVTLTMLGPYPVSMVSVPGAAVKNASPPSLALLALGLAQTGLALVLAPAGRRWLADRRRWTRVVAANAVVMTLYLWHLAAVVVGAIVLRAGAFPDAPIGSARWWLLRPAWLALLAALLAGIVALFSGAERSQPRPVGNHPSTTLAAVAALLLAAGLVRFTLVGVSDPLLSSALFGCGLALLRLAVGSPTSDAHTAVGESPDVPKPRALAEET